MKNKLLSRTIFVIIVLMLLAINFLFLTHVPNIRFVALIWVMLTLVLRNLWKQVIPAGTKKGTLLWFSGLSFAVYLSCLITMATEILNQAQFPALDAVILLVSLVSGSLMAVAATSEIKKLKQLQLK